MKEYPPEANKIFSFLEETGIPFQFRSIPAGDCFLPGLLIENGSVIIDEDNLLYPGDILHEAAHLAVIPAAERAHLNGKDIGSRPHNAAEEMMAIAWSYAACVYLSIDPYFVFHNEGYHGGGHELADNFKEGRYFGTPMLQWAGLTAENAKAKELGVNPYPSMIRWLRD